MNEHYYSVLKLMDDRNKENISVTHSSFAELGLDEDTLDEILISLFEKGLYEKAIISNHPNFKGLIFFIKIYHVICKIFKSFLESFS